MKNKKAAGAHKLPSELLKYDGEALHWVITNFWEEEVLPEECMKGIVCPIYKKSNNYGITGTISRSHY